MTISDLSLTTRAANGVPLTIAQHDTDLTAIQTAVNAIIDVLDNRAYVCVGISANQVMESASETLELDTDSGTDLVFDTQSAFNTTTFAFTPPSTGYYYVSAAIDLLADTTDTGDKINILFQQVNGDQTVLASSAITIPDSTSRYELKINKVCYLESDNTYTVGVTTNSETTFPTIRNSRQTFLSIAQLPG